MVTTDTSVTPAGTCKDCKAEVTVGGVSSVAGSPASVGFDLSVSVTAGDTTVLILDIQTGWAGWSYIDSNGDLQEGGNGWFVGQDLDLCGYFTGTVGTEEDPGTKVSISFESKLALADPYAGDLEPDELPDGLIPRGAGMGAGGATVTWGVGVEILDP